MSVPTESTLSKVLAPLVFADSAAAKVAALITEEGNSNLKLRVFIQGGVVQVFLMVLDLMKTRMTTTQRYPITACHF